MSGSASSIWHHLAWVGLAAAASVAALTLLVFGLGRPFSGATLVFGMAIGWGVGSFAEARWLKRRSWRAAGVAFLVPFSFLGLLSLLYAAAGR